MARGNAMTARPALGISRIAATLAPYSITVLRVLLGLTFVLHGLPKFSNLAGFSGFVGSLGMPAPLAVLIPVLEVGGGLLLIAGLATRWVSLLFVLLMLATTLLVKLSVGFIAPGNAPGTGAELDLLLAAGAFVLFCYGAGKLALDDVVRPGAR
ncbi:MAG: DoxX family protein [Chloroflexales bacterium]|nr:DoxX family protein [Chloroflexales bacterium]